MKPQTMIWVGLAGLLFLGLLLLVTVMQPMGNVREAARKFQSQDHLHNITIALHNYEGVSGLLLPAASTTDLTVAGDLSSTTDLHGWQTLLLPYVERKPLFSRIDQSLPWDDPVNATPLMERVDVYENPGVVLAPTPAGLAPTHYSANSQVMTTVPLKFSDVTDGLSNTIFSGEITTSLPPWGQPRNVRNPADGLHTSPRSFGGPWPGGETQFGFLDGRASRINPNIDPKVLRALATPAGGETVTPP